MGTNRINYGRKTQIITVNSTRSHHYVGLQKHEGEERITNKNNHINLYPINDYRINFQNLDLVIAFRITSLEYRN